MTLELSAASPEAIPPNKNDKTRHMPNYPQCKNCKAMLRNDVEFQKGYCMTCLNLKAAGVVKEK